MDTTHQIWIATTNENIKSIKTALEQANIYDKASRIQKATGDIDEPFISVDGKTQLLKHHSLIPTTILKSSGQTIPIQVISSLPLGLEKYALFVARQPFHANAESSCNLVCRAAQLWLEQLGKYSENEIQHILEAESWNYQAYHPLLLLGPASFKSNAWNALLKDITLVDQFPKLYSMMCSATDCTHVAINGRILPDIKSGSSQGLVANVLRSPSCLIPLHGKFGSQTDVATENTFAETLWALATQNGIHQIFAPIHTMFSRGNVKEKARILCLAQLETEPYTAVDLYAGIGYFAFSYAKGGAAVVLGWEINDWSVEGFRRGSIKNGWEAEVHKKEESTVGPLRSWLDQKQRTVSHSPKLVIFLESNEAAPERVEDLRNTLPPVRHVNCGYLPSSSRSWSVAVQCLDLNQGGCIHVHENVHVNRIETRGFEIQQTFESLLKRHRSNADSAVECKHIERVKSYAPGVWHCVFDVYVNGQMGSL